MTQLAYQRSSLLRCFRAANSVSLLHPISDMHGGRYGRPPRRVGRPVSHLRRHDEAELLHDPIQFGHAAERRKAEWASHDIKAYSQKVTWP
jgi:hypothetical protein